MLKTLTRNYHEIMDAIAKGTPAEQRQAIVDSPWTGGHYRNGRGFPQVAAKGFLGTTSGPMLVGEAGAETVAILRNPRSASLTSMGGSSGPVTININGPVVRNDQDISSLARQVAIEVERSLSRKGQMFGLRGPAV
jgi:hypothetical protein